MTTTGVNYQRVQLLIDALRSGEYEQGHGTLHRSEWSPEGKLVREEVCCLEVANLVAFANGCPMPDFYEFPPSSGGERGRHTARHYVDGVGPWGENSTTMLGAVVAWYGFNPAMDGNLSLVAATEDRRIHASRASRGYSAMLANDVVFFTFDEIADDIAHTFGL